MEKLSLFCHLPNLLFCVVPGEKLAFMMVYSFFTARCTMHSAKRGLAIACRLSVCDVGDL